MGMGYRLLKALATVILVREIELLYLVSVRTAYSSMISNIFAFLHLLGLALAKNSALLADINLQMYFQQQL